MMFTQRDHLYFFFDFISHNAWLAWHKMPVLAQRYGLILEPVPVLFAGLLQAHNQRGPAEVPAKLNWMLWNVLRKAQQHNIPISPPHTHPFNPLPPLRAACCDLPRDARFRLIQALFSATWVESRAVSQIDVVGQVIRESGLDSDAVLQQMQSESVKTRLRLNTEAAVKAGVFGVPSMKIGDELFWGFDDLPQLESFLAGTDPLDPDRSAYADWQRVQPSAQRKS
jgi:2-hydroxychromene-2-carboxylate isomerase